MARKPCLLIASLLLGVLLLSGVDARKLHRSSSVSITNEDGTQTGTITSNGDGSVVEASSTGTNVAFASASVSSTPDGQTAEVGTFGDGVDGSLQGLGLESGPRPRPRPSTPRSSGAGVTGSGSVTVGGGNASAGGSGSTSVNIISEARIQAPADDNEIDETETAVAPAPVPAPLPEDEDDVDEVKDVTQEAPQVSASEPTPKSAPVPEPKAPVSDMEVEKDEDSDTDNVQKITVAGMSGRHVCLMSDTSNMDILLEEGYQVTILTPIRMGYDIITIRQSDYAIIETSMILDYVPEEVQKLCNYDPETAPVPARKTESPAVQSPPVPARETVDPAVVFARECLSKSVLYRPGFINMCWEAGLPTYADIVFSG